MENNCLTALYLVMILTKVTKKIVMMIVMMNLSIKDVNERYSLELMNMVMQKYQAAEVGTFNPNLPLPM